MSRDPEERGTPFYRGGNSGWFIAGILVVAVVVIGFWVYNGSGDADSVAVDVETPAETTPAEPAPADPVPDEPAPAEPAPEEPADATPAEPAPTDTTPAEPAPADGE